MVTRFCASNAPDFRNLTFDKTSNRDFLVLVVCGTTVVRRPASENLPAAGFGWFDGDIVFAVAFMSDCSKSSGFHAASKLFATLRLCVR